jgi:hypothetical protein
MIVRSALVIGNVTRFHHKTAASLLALTGFTLTDLPQSRQIVGRDDLFLANEKGAESV